MKKISWIFPALMLLVAAENLFWDFTYDNFAAACYPVMGLLLLLSVLMTVRFRSTGERRFLVLLILIFVLYLLIALFRTNLQEMYEDATRRIWEEVAGGCWTMPEEQDWK